MLRRIVLSLILFSFIALLILWFLSGGPHSLVGNTTRSIQGLQDPFNLRDDEGALRLPWQPKELFPTINITPSPIVDVESSFSYDNIQMQQGHELAQLEGEYDRLQKQLETERAKGVPSPYAGMVHISQSIDGLKESDLQNERIELTANFTNTGAVDITGWSLESALTRARYYIPRAASPFLSGLTNQLTPTYLDPGATAIISTGASPVGTSFRENMCTGYLQQFQRFNPPLYEECPAPSSVLPLTPENIERYGDTCYDALSTIERCRFPATLPGEPNALCKNYLANELSYNGCVSRNKYRIGFHSPLWRIYLNARSEIWRNSHDAIRLLDAEGKTVDMITY